MDGNQPLVSIPIITYNSSRFVLDTLESVKCQTYSNLELIISDDCSTDNTVDLCYKWIGKNKQRFSNVKVLTSPTNTGVTANMSRAESECAGDYVKVIAGDDLLCPDCIEKYINYVNKHPNTVYLFGKVEVFGESDEKIKRFNDTIFDYSFFDLSLEQQYRWLVTRSIQPIPAATSFYNITRAKQLGIIYDERIPMLEDWPRWIQCLEKGVKFEFIDEVVANYRVSENSICSGEKHSKLFAQSFYQMYFLYQFMPRWRLEGGKNALRTYVAYKNLYFDRKNLFWKGLWKMWCILEKDANNKLSR